MTSAHDYKTYWDQTFNIDIQSFDCNINSDPESSGDFHGRIDGVIFTLCGPPSSYSIVLHAPDRSTSA